MFRALDHRQRTDTWFPNRRELGHTDSWDSDSDSDGLLDGQEVEGITEVNTRTVPQYDTVRYATLDAGQTYDTSPLEADTDGDGYWDGWLSVYGVENSRNVVLYQEHLRDDDDNDGRTDDDGLAPGERVPARAGPHNLSKALSAMGADVDDDDLRGTRTYISTSFTGDESEWKSNMSAYDRYGVSNPDERLAGDRGNEQRLLIVVLLLRYHTAPATTSLPLATKLIN